MEFNTLKSDTICDCLIESEENFNDVFCLKTNNKKLRDVDFNSKWEKGERPNSKDCKTICSKKGKSISIFKKDKEKDLIKIFSELFRISPTYKPYLTKIKFSSDTGVIKKTPTKRNQYHYDFYKSDNFKLSNVKYLGSIPLEENV